jgi:hypothetical protein
MSERAKQFSLIATAERHLCDAAESVFIPIIRAVEAEAGLCITEVRVTFNPVVDSGGPIANCTIVGAYAAAPAAHHDAHHAAESQHAVESMRIPGAGSSASQE